MNTDGFEYKKEKDLFVYNDNGIWKKGENYEKGYWTYVGMNVFYSISLILHFQSTAHI